jgi:hypothetical protein
LVSYFVPARRPNGGRVSEATYGIVRHGNKLRVLLSRPGAGRGGKCRKEYLGLFATAAEARAARDRWLLANVAGACEVYPWLRGRG